MGAFIETLLDRLLATSLQTIALATVVWLLCRLVPRLSPATQCWLWWLVALQALAGLVVEPVRLPWLPLTDAASPSQSPAFGRVVAPATEPTLFDLGLPTWQVTAFLFWVVGIVAMATATVQGWRRVRGLLRSSSTCTDANLSTALTAVCEAHDVRKKPELRLSEHIDSPVLIGRVRPALLLPTRVALSAAELDMALAHEVAHLRRGDLWWGCIPALVRHLFFFHPCVHLAFREYVLAREASCDAAVVQAERISRRDYGSLLLRLGTHHGGDGELAVASPTYRSLSRRLTMLQNTSFLPRAGSLCILVAIAATGILPLRLVVAAAPAPEARETIVTRAAITYMPAVDDYYPTVSRYLGETGTTRVNACYQSNGRVTTVTVSETSQHIRLDSAALRLARMVRIEPGTLDGDAVPGCIILPIEFRLPDPGQ